MTTDPHDPLASPRTVSGKYLVVELGDRRCGLRVLRVREVLGRREVAPAAGDPARDVVGTLDVGDERLSVLDLRRLRGAGGEGAPDEGFALVLELPGASPFEYVWVACLVDEVRGVVDVSVGDVEESGEDEVLGHVRGEDGELTLLDVDAIVARTGVLGPPADDVSTPAA